MATRGALQSFSVSKESWNKRRIITPDMAAGTALADKIKRSEKITNSELRRTLAAYRGEVQPDQEG